MVHTGSLLITRIFQYSVTKKKRNHLFHDWFPFELCIQETRSCSNSDAEERYTVDEYQPDPPFWGMEVPGMDKRTWYRKSSKGNKDEFENAYPSRISSTLRKNGNSPEPSLIAPPFWNTEETSKAPRYPEMVQWSKRINEFMKMRAEGSLFQGKVDKPEFFLRHKAKFPSKENHIFAESGMMQGWN